MYLIEGGYAELHPVSYDFMKRHEGKAKAAGRALGPLTLAFRRCEVTYCSFSVGGAYAEKQPDLSAEDIAHHLRLNEELRELKRRQMWEKENAHKPAGVLVLFVR